MTRRLLLALILMLLPLPALAVLPDEILADPKLEQRARDLSSQLRCMVCQNQSIDASDAELARDLRILVRERISSGDSDSAVIDYVVSRYGEFVLLNPRFSARNAALWLLPIILLICGAIGFFAYLRSRPALSGSVPLSADEEQRIKDLLEP